MVQSEKKHHKQIDGNLKKFIQKFEGLIEKEKYQKAYSLLSLLEKKEDTFLEEYNKRKQHGVYYTDSILASFIVQKTLLTFLNEKLGLSLKSIEHLKGLKPEICRNLIDLLMTISVCDPTCGSGNFLISTGEIMFEIIKKVQGKKKSQNFKITFLRNLYGFDINPTVISLCKLKLIKWVFKDNVLGLKNYQDIKRTSTNNIQVCNSLMDLNGKGFDIIIGNPPYGNILSDDEKKTLKEQGIYYKDAYCAFILKTLEICSGYVGFLVPKSFLLRQSYLTFRNTYLSQSNIVELYNIGSNEFKNATNEVQILIYGIKNAKNKGLKVYSFPNREIIHYKGQRFDDLRACFNRKCSTSNFAKRFFFYTFKEECPVCSSPTTPLNRIRIKCNKEIFNLLEQIEKRGDLNYLSIKKFPNFIRGEEAQGLKRVKAVLKNNNNNGSCYYLDAKYDFDYFYFKQSQKFDLESINADVLKGSSKEYYVGPKLLIKHNNIYPEALYTKENTCFTSSIYSLLHEQSSELKYLCALLNSAVIHFYCIYAINNQNDTTINLNQYMIRHLPIMSINNTEKEKIAKLVGMISRRFEESNGHLTGDVRNKIITLNDLIFNAYNIETNQQKLIQDEVKKHNPFYKKIY